MFYVDPHSAPRDIASGTGTAPGNRVPSRASMWHDLEQGTSCHVRSAPGIAVRGRATESSVTA